MISPKVRFALRVIEFAGGVLELSPGEANLALDKKKRAKPSEEAGQKLAPSETGSISGEASATSPERSAEAVSGQTPEGGSGLSGVGDFLDRLSSKAKAEVGGTGAARTKAVMGGLKEKKPEPLTRDVPPASAETEEAEPSDQSAQEAWIEDYDEHINGEEPPPPRPRKKRHVGSIIVLVAIIIFLIVWTLFTPNVMPETGPAYETWEPNLYLGEFVGYRDIWAGNMTWGLAIRGPDATSVDTAINISVLVTKVDEKPGNWFFQGTSVSLKNVSIYIDDLDSTYLGSMSDWRETDLGLLATVSISFDRPGEYDLYVYVKFMVFTDMRVGFLPLEAVQVPRAYLDVPIVVT